jgi:hypothetical protein
MAAGNAVFTFWLPAGSVDLLTSPSPLTGGAEACQVTDQNRRPVFREERGQIPDAIPGVAVEQFPDFIIGGIVR